MTERPDAIDRREFLKSAGIVAGGAGFVGIGWYATASDETASESAPDDGGAPITDDDSDSDGPSADVDSAEQQRENEQSTEEGTTDEYADSFETVVDAVDAGADPDGTEPINFLFTDNTEDSTLFRFEPGTYKMEPFQIEDRADVGLVGTGTAQTQFVPADGVCRGGHPFVFFKSVRNLLLADILFDFRDIESGGSMHLFLQGESKVENVSYRGSCSNQLSVLRIHVSDASGSCLVDGFESKNTQGNNTLTGVFVSDSHAGELTLRNCTLDGFSDNGIYASSPGKQGGGDGPVNVVGGTFSNNNIAGVRLGSTGSTARDVTVVVDSETSGWGQLNARGIRLRNRSGQVVDNCSIRFGADAADSFGAIVFHPDSGGATVRDTTIEMHDSETPAIKAFPVAAQSAGAPTFETLSVTGTATGGVTADIENRDGTTFRNCTIDQQGPGRGGLSFRRSEDCHVVESEISVGGAPVILDDASVRLEDTVISNGRGERHFENRVVDETLTL